MQRYKMTHDIFGIVEFFTTENPPYFLTCKESKWFYEKHILRMTVGELICTDFHIIERIE